MTTKDVLALALEALEKCRFRSLVDKIVDPAITAIKQAQEPVDVEDLVDVAYRAWQDKTTFDVGKVRAAFRAVLAASKQAPAP